MASECGRQPRERFDIAIDGDSVSKPLERDFRVFPVYQLDRIFRIADRIGFAARAQLSL